MVRTSKMLNVALELALVDSLDVGFKCTMYRLRLFSAARVMRYPSNLFDQRRDSFYLINHVIDFALTFRKSLA